MMLLMDMRDIRRTRLRAYCDTHFGGNEAELARRVKRAQSQINGMLTGKKAFGEKIARIIELQLGLLPGWLDVVDGASPESSPPPVRDTILDDLATLLPEDADIWRAQIRAAAIKVRRERERDAMHNSRTATAPDTVEPEPSRTTGAALGGMVLEPQEMLRMARLSSSGGVGKDYGRPATTSGTSSLDRNSGARPPVAVDSKDGGD